MPHDPSHASRALAHGALYASPPTLPSTAMSDLRLYNTLTRQVEPFVPADGTTVRMYTCGPTVYNPAHLGNFRTFLFEDLMRRVLALRGWRAVSYTHLRAHETRHD